VLQFGSVFVERGNANTLRGVGGSYAEPHRGVTKEVIDTQKLEEPADVCKFPLCRQDRIAESIVASVKNLTQQDGVIDMRRGVQALAARRKSGNHERLSDKESNVGN
jgi:hypothetical protein